MAPESFAGATREDLIAMILALAEENEGLRAQVKVLHERVAELERQRRQPPASAPSSQRPVWD
ncbi:MAG: hypothetical protein HXY24_17415, partial [Rubrivivax sp.]|nr:hypothetical protein [Rubrivivax sp.]